MKVNWGLDLCFPGRARQIFPILRRVLMQKQHDGYAQVLRDNGVEIIYADLPDRLAGIYLPRIEAPGIHHH